MARQVLSGATVQAPVEPWKLYDHVVVIGTGALPARCAEHLLDAGVKVDLLIEPERDRFRSIEHLARRRQLRYFSGAAASITESLMALGGSCFILSANNNYVFPRQVCEVNAARILNFHGGLLPGYAGRNTATWVVFNNVAFHGATWHLVDAAVDSGPVLARAEFPVAATATAGQLMTRAIELGFDLFRTHWSRLLDPAERGRSQELPNVTYKSTDLPNGGELCRTWSFDVTCRFLRAMDYGPIGVVRPPRIVADGRVFEIARYRILPGSASAAESRPLGSRNARSMTLRFPDGTIQLAVRPAPGRTE
ncbi:MAG TPA: formyltransferase family protein [Gemmatimonadales bacterium]|nr:formyltransferase family protein [Gemmatimonadales bacterium]